MKKLVLDAETIAKLSGLTEQVEVFDEQGNLLAHIVPTADGFGLGSVPAKYHFTDEELEEARRQSGPTKTLDDILREAGML